jgi:hypothetical protein
MRQPSLHFDGHDLEKRFAGRVFSDWEADDEAVQGRHSKF